MVRVMVTTRKYLLGHVTSGREPSALLAGVTFLDLSASRAFGLRGLGLWFEEHVVATGCMAACPTAVFEPPIGRVNLYPWNGRIVTAGIDVACVIGHARARVVSALRGLIATPSEDRFLRGAIFIGSARRLGSRWVARPAQDALLSGVVLSLFAVAILSDRGVYERELCVCNVCGRVSFNAQPDMRTACARHTGWTAPQQYRHSMA
jgi:hypothetical protein